MPVIFVMGQDEIRHEARLEFLERFLEQLTLERKESVAKPIDDGFAPGTGASQENFRRASSLLDSHGILAGEHHPLHFELGVGLGKLQNRATGANFNVVAMGAEAKQALHAS